MRSTLAVKYMYMYVHNAWFSVYRLVFLKLFKQRDPDLQSQYYCSVAFFS